MSIRSTSTVRGLTALPVGMRALSLFTVGLAMLGQLAGVAHLALVRHSVCPEHGELVHADELGAGTDEAVFGDGPQASARTPASSKHPTVRNDAGNVAGHEHGHCEVVVERRQQAMLVSAALVAVPVASPTQRLVSDTTATQRFGIALIALAPKCSPPSA